MVEAAKDLSKTNIGDPPLHLPRSDLDNLMNTCAVSDIIHSHYGESASVS